MLALLAVALHDGFLHIRYGLLVRDNAGNLEECRLEDGVGTSAESDFCRDFCRVDYIKGDVLLADDGLHMVWNPLKGLLLIPKAVQKKGSVLLDAFEDIIFCKV